jgi:DNA-binding transcriptional ArsR family regulator
MGVAEPWRREVLNLLQGRELAAGAIAARFSVSRPAVSQHLQVLKEAGLVKERRDGTRRIYSLRREGFSEVAAFFSGFWDDALPRLRQAAEAEEQRRKR